jgi:hypothetical protein
MLQKRGGDSNKSSNLDTSSLKPTPGYNMCVLEDAASLGMSKLLASAFNACPTLVSAVVLMKVGWSN